MRRAWLVVAAGLALAGCGDDRLWARWQAERALVGAQRAADRVLVRPASARPADWEAAERAYRAIARRWPPARWADRGDRGLDVCRISGRAMLSVATLRGWRGDEEGALEAYREAQQGWAAFPEVALRGAEGERHALEALGRFDEALPVLHRIALDFPLIDPQTGKPSAAVLDAPLQLAHEWRARGNAAAAESVLAAAQSRATAALRPTRPPVELVRAASDYAEARGDLAGALGTLRRLVAPGADEGRRREAVLALGAAALRLAAPDTALAYARWALAMGGRSLARAHLLAGQAHEALGAADSALDDYALVLEAPRDPENMRPLARWRRAELFERRGHWEEARSQWSALQASAPTDPLAFRSLLRIVQHHEARGEAELARREAENALMQMQQLIAMNADPDVQRQAGAVRAELLERYGTPADAIAALATQWRRWPDDSAACAAGLAAARLAQRTPGEQRRADSLYAALASAARDVDVRRAAARERGR